jgi:hypothetical protein
MFFHVIPMLAQINIIWVLNILQDFLIVLHVIQIAPFAVALHIPIAGIAKQIFITTTFLRLQLTIRI